VLASKGFAALTVADVAREAGLSPGIVIFYFTSKDGLLAEVLSALAAEYHHNWSFRMRAAGPTAAAQLRDMLLADFDTNVFTPEKLAAWVAFWGEAQGRPVHDQICGPYDVDRRSTLERLCQQIDSEGGYAIEPRLTASTLLALCDGLWLSVAAHGAGHKDRTSAADAQKIVIVALASLFPRHYAPVA
jgi:TetR/AcrR family transcriptional repressor of bet genes